MTTLDETRFYAGTTPMDRMQIREDRRKKQLFQEHQAGYIKGQSLPLNNDYHNSGHSLLNIQLRMNLLAQEISERGYFLHKGEADWLYENNSDPFLTVRIDASKLKVQVTKGSGWLSGEESCSTDYGYGRVGDGSTMHPDFLVHGTVHVTTEAYRGGTKYHIGKELYNFEIKPWGTHFKRNILTIIAEPHNGGVPFWIEYYNSATVE